MATGSLKTSTRPLPEGKISYEQFLQWLDWVYRALMPSARVSLSR